MTERHHLRLQICECGDYRHQHVGPEWRGACSICAVDIDRLARLALENRPPCARFTLMTTEERTDYPFLAPMAEVVG